MKAFAPTLTAADLEIVSTLFEAAADSTRFVTALELIARHFRASSATLMTPDLQPVAGGLGAIFGGAPLAIEAYHAYYREKDIWLQAAQRKGLAGAGAVVTSEKLVDDDTFLRSEYYTDYLRPQGLRRMLLATIADGSDNQPRVMLSLMRGEHEGPFDDEDVDRLRHLMPHLRRAVALQQHIGEVLQRRAAIEAALGGLSFGVILTTPDAEAFYVNPTAQRVLAARDGLATINGTLAADDSATTRQLTLAIQRAAGVAAGRGSAIGAALRLPRPSDAAPYTIIVAPLKIGWPVSSGKRRPSVAIFIFGLDGGPDMPLPALMSAFNLTRTEAKVLNLLAEGCTVAEVSERLEVTTNTVRTHLKHLFHKMGCSRQSDAIRLSLSLRSVLTETAPI